MKRWTTSNELALRGVGEGLSGERKAHPRKVTMEASRFLEWNKVRALLKRGSWSNRTERIWGLLGVVVERIGNVKAVAKNRFRKKTTRKMY